MRVISAVAGVIPLVLGLAGPVFAESPPAFPDFQAKRVKPPKAGESQRITIQVTPEDMARQRGTVRRETSLATDLAQENPVAARAATYAWFWEHVSPDLSDTGPGRLRPALDKLSNPPAGAVVQSPRLQQMMQIARAQGIDILQSTIGTDVSPALVLAVITVESAGQVDVVSGAGAEGLMQLMPDTAERFGVQDAFEPEDNIRGGVAYLDFLMKEFDHDPILVLAGYNAGEGAVKSHEGVPPFVETRDYVPKVLAAYAVARGLCKTPPELITDGCVFSTM